MPSTGVVRADVTGCGVLGAACCGTAMEGIGIGGGTGAGTGAEGKELVS